MNWHKEHDYISPASLDTSLKKNTGSTPALGTKAHEIPVLVLSMATWIDVLGVVATIIGLVVAIPTLYCIGRTLYNRFCYVRRRHQRRAPAHLPV